MSPMTERLRSAVSADFGTKTGVPGRAKMQLKKKV